MNVHVWPAFFLLGSVLASWGCSSDSASQAAPVQDGEQASGPSSASGGAGLETAAGGQPATITAGAGTAGGTGGTAAASGAGGTVTGGTAAAANAGSTVTGGTAAAANADGGTATGGASTVSSGLPASCSGACNAAALANPQLTDYGALGNVTMYTTLASDGGACQYGATGVMYFAAINVNLSPNDGQGQWQEGRFCGQCVEVTTLTSQGPKQIVVRIMDRCADEYCGIDLGGAAPADIMADGFGRYEGAWRLVSCIGHPETFDGDPSLFVKEGSNAYWAAVQVRNPDTAVTAIDWQKQDDPSSQGTFEYASPSIENYYLVPEEVLAGNATYLLTVRYADGSTATVSVTSAQLAEPLGIYPLD